MPRTVYEYERIKTSVDNQRILREKGWTPVFSSNVSAIQRRLNNLYIRFHNSSIYVYPQQGSKFGELLTSPSKGKWVWDNLRRKNVAYSKVGSLPLEGDRDLTDKELEAEIMKRGLLVRNILRVASENIQVSPLQLVAGSTSEELTTGLLVGLFIGSL